MSSSIYLKIMWLIDKCAKTASFCSYWYSLIPNKFPSTIWTTNFHTALKRNYVSKTTVSFLTFTMCFHLSSTPKDRTVEEKYRVLYPPSICHTEFRVAVDAKAVKDWKGVLPPVLLLLSAAGLHWCYSSSGRFSKKLQHVQKCLTQPNRKPSFHFLWLQTKGANSKPRQFMST